METAAEQPRVVYLSQMYQRVLGRDGDGVVPSRIPIDRGALAQFCRTHGIAELALFGSVLRNDFREDSDVDVLVEFIPSHHVSLMDHVRMQREMETWFGRKVDLVSKGALRGRIRDRILNSYEVQYVNPR